MKNPQSRVETAAVSSKIRTGTAKKKQQWQLLTITGHATVFLKLHTFQCICLPKFNVSVIHTA